MTTAYTSLLGLALPVDGELTGTWGQTVNNYITTYLDGAVAGTQIISGSLTAVTLSKTTGTSLSQAGTGATGSSQYQIIRCTGNPASLLTITVPAADKTYVVINATSTSQSVKIVGVGPTPTGVTITSGSKAIVAWNGSDFVEVSPGTVTSVAATVPSFLSVSGSPITSSGTLAISLSGTALPVANGGTGSTSTTYCSLSTNVSGTLPVANGGTGATTAAAARTNLEATTVGGNVFTLTNPSAITFPRFNADNTVSALDAATFRTAIGAGSGGGSVTSVSGTGTVSGLSLSGTVTSSGSLTLSGSITGFLPLAGGTMTGLLTAKELALTKTAPSISAGVLTLDYSLSNTFAVSLNAAITSFTVSNIPTSGSYYEFNLEFTADGTARSVTWTFSSVAVKWPGGTAPTLTSTNGKKDTFVFYTYDAGTTWLGFVAGQNL